MGKKIWVNIFIHQKTKLFLKNTAKLFQMGFPLSIYCFFTKKYYSHSSHFRQSKYTISNLQGEKNQPRVINFSMKTFTIYFLFSNIFYKIVYEPFNILLTLNIRYTTFTLSQVRRMRRIFFHYYIYPLLYISFTTYILRRLLCFCGKRELVI